MTAHTPPDSSAPHPRDPEDAMPLSHLEDDVRRALADLLGLPPDGLSPEQDLAEVAADSFVLVQVMLELQQEHDVVFSHDDVRTLRTVADVTALVQRLRRDRG
jgi:acyl carrier protein